MGCDLVQLIGCLLTDGADPCWIDSFVINGMGFLNRYVISCFHGPWIALTNPSPARSPKNPDIPGFTSFAGRLGIAHTARWPQNLVIKPTDRVGVIGTGSSGLQVCGAIAPQVKQGHLSVFMRTPSYILPEQAPLTFTPEMKKTMVCSFSRGTRGLRLIPRFRGQNDRKYFWKYTLEGWEAAERFFTVYFGGSRNQKQVLERGRFCSGASRRLLF